MKTTVNKVELSSDVIILENNSLIDYYKNRTLTLLQAGENLTKRFQTRISELEAECEGHKRRICELEDLLQEYATQKAKPKRKV